MGACSRCRGISVQPFATEMTARKARSFAPPLHFASQHRRVVEAQARRTLEPWHHREPIVRPFVLALPIFAIAVTEARADELSQKHMADSMGCARNAELMLNRCIDSGQYTVKACKKAASAWEDDCTARANRSYRKALHDSDERNREYFRWYDQNRDQYDACMTDLGATHDEKIQKQICAETCRNRDAATCVRLCRNTLLYAANMAKDICDERMQADFFERPTKLGKALDACEKRFARKADKLIACQDKAEADQKAEDAKTGRELLRKAEQRARTEIR